MLRFIFIFGRFFPKGSSYLKIHWLFAGKNVMRRAPLLYMYMEKISIVVTPSVPFEINCLLFKIIKMNFYCIFSFLMACSITQCGIPRFQNIRFSCRIFSIPCVWTDKSVEYCLLHMKTLHTKISVFDFACIWK